MLGKDHIKLGLAESSLPSYSKLVWKSCCGQPGLRAGWGDRLFSHVFKIYTAFFSLWRWWELSAKPIQFCLPKFAVILFQSCQLAKFMINGTWKLLCLSYVGHKLSSALNSHQQQQQKSMVSTVLLLKALSYAGNKPQGFKCGLRRLGEK